MKFSQKIFLIAFLLIIIAMDISGYIMISQNHKSNVEKETNSAILENSAIVNLLYHYGLNTQETKPNIIIGSLPITQDEEIARMLSNLNETSPNLYIDIYSGDNLIYSNGIEEIEEIEPERGNVRSIIKQIGESSYIFTTSEIEINETLYRVNTSKDLTEIFLEREEQIQTFSNVSICLTLFSALILAFCIYFITRRIRKLQNKVIRVSNGDYSVKSEIRGRDEIAMLNECFDTMLDSVNENIEEIERISENKQIFINDITHEIRSPLTSIIGFSDLLYHMKITDSQTVEKYAGKIYEEGKYIENLTQSLMEIILLDNEKVNLESLNVSTIVQQTIEMAKDMVREYNIQIVERIVPEVYQRVEADLIKSLLLNLIKNSSKAYEQGGMVHIYLNHDALKVIDYGKGIPEEEIQRIQEPFYQLDKARNRKKGGMGLGLPLCKKIAQIHHFSFEIESTVGKGTTVTIGFLEERGRI